ncbi:MAG: hypothetical protein ACK2UH_14810, partial [Candidatus Promineifilaceae bacterium]
MKIKRFEASSMQDALRKIKKEFGEEAVILSAKTMKKNSLLGKNPMNRVVVTAAVDKSPAPAPPEDLDAVVSPPADTAPEDKSNAGEDYHG